MDLVRPGAVRLLVEVDEEPSIERIAAVRPAVELRQPALDPGIELVVHVENSEFDTYTRSPSSEFCNI